MELFIALASLMVALVETFLLYKAIGNTRRARLVANLAVSRIGELEHGIVKVEGHAVAAGEILCSPLAGKDCVLPSPRKKAATRRTS